MATTTVAHARPSGPDFARAVAGLSENGQADLGDLDPNATALIVVDMQHFDAARDAGEGRTAQDLGVASHFKEYFGQIDAITPRIASLIALFREKRMEVVHLRVAELTRDSRDVGLKQLVRGLVVPIDSKEAEFLPGLEPAGDEIVVSKSASGVFPATNLDRILRNVGIRTLIFTGTSTSGCIQSAVYDALDLGYRVAIVADGCADATDASHEAAIESFAGTGVAVLATDECRRALAAISPADPGARSGLERVKPYLPTAPFLPNDRALSEVSPYSLIFGPAIRLRLARVTTALVLMDAQGLTCNPGSSFGPALAGYDGLAERASRAVDGMARLLAASRRLDCPVIHIRTGCFRHDGRDLSPKLTRLGVRPIVGGADAEFMPEVAPRPGEAVLTKPGSGIFTGTGLDERLRNLGIETIILAGISIDGALEASIRSAGDRGYGVLLVPDACAGSQHLERSLWDFEKGIINVKSIQDTIASLEEAAG
jgi:nicotinamidase-related amidase